jgi:uncharacterized protein (DUF2236 family)
MSPPHLAIHAVSTALGPALDETASPSHDDVISNAPKLGPGSLTWDHFGDLRGLLLIFRVGLLQNMHPAVSRALEQHSGEVFLKNPWNRLLRSARPITGVIYAPDAGEVGRRVRDYHSNIKGELSTGESYHALSPDLFYWTHATFFEGIISGCEHFGTPLSESEQEQLYQESIAWYARYGLSMRPVPPDYASFKKYWAGMLASLKPTPITSHALKMRRTPPPFEFIPRPLWWLMDPMITGMSLWIARGTLPPQARDALGLRWSAADARRLKAFSLVVKAVMGALPKEWRYLPMAKQWRAQAAKSTTAK